MVRLSLVEGEQHDHKEWELEWIAEAAARKRMALLKETEASVVGLARTTVRVLLSLLINGRGWLDLSQH
jgi:hypothetical protein